MPFFKEYHLNAHTMGRGFFDNSYAVTDSTQLTTFRGSQPKSRIYENVPDTVADPYAWFLQENSRKRYREALALRGLTDNGSPDNGHPFESIKHTVIGSPIGLIQFSGRDVSGLFPELEDNPSLGIHDGTVLGPSSFSRAFSDDLSTFAQQAYARSAPTSVVFDAGTFLGELREGLPRLVPDLLKGNLRILRNAGSDYLNVKFGWEPLIQDVKNAATALAQATQQLRPQGERIHRSYGVPASTIADSKEFFNPRVALRQTSRGLIPQSAMLAEFPDYSSSSGFTVRARSYSLSQSRTSRRWFEGSFSSFYPLGFDPDDYLSRANALIKLKLDPETLWNLAPWTWLVDWNLRIGDSIRANQLAANDLLVMHYGYAMEKIVDRSAFTASGFFSENFSVIGMPNQWSAAAVSQRKRRIRANPYGFTASTPDALTMDQLGILGALGLTKFKR